MNMEELKKEKNRIWVAFNQDTDEIICAGYIYEDVNVKAGKIAQENKHLIYLRYFIQSREETESLLIENIRACADYIENEMGAKW